MSDPRAVSRFTSGLALVLLAGASGAVHAAPRTNHGTLEQKLSSADKMGLLGLQPVPGAKEASYQIVGVPRLGLPTLRFDTTHDVGSIIDPAAVAASWDPGIARRSGDLFARIVRAGGAAQAMTGLADLVPSPFSRSFLSEDPLLSGTLAGEAAAAMQGQHVMPIIGRTTPSEPFELDTAEKSDVSANDARLAVQSVAIAADIAPGTAVLCPQVRTKTALWCDGAGPAITALRAVDVVDGAVIAAPGAVSSAKLGIEAGVDMGAQADGFGPAMATALPPGKAGAAALDIRVKRLLRSWRAAGVIDHPAAFRGLDVQIPSALKVEQTMLRGQAILEGAVLLRNRAGVLPLRSDAAATGASKRSLLVIGEGTLGAPAAAIARALSSVLPEDEVQATDATQKLDHANAVVILFDGVHDTPALSAAMDEAAGHDVPVVALCLCHGMPDLAVAEGADALAVTWGWRDEDAAPLARLLSGRADFSGRLPASWPMTGDGYESYQTRDRTHHPAQFPFGFGLSLFRQPGFSDLRVRDDGVRLHVVFTVTNPGEDSEIAVPELYLDRPAGTSEPPKRLVGWRRVPLGPHQSLQIGMDVPSLLRQRWDQTRQAWRVDPGVYSLSLGRHEADLPLHISLSLAETQVPHAPPPAAGQTL